MTDIWDAKIYGKYLDQRTRPARDLLSAIPDSFLPTLVYDLGCGPGNSTILLKNRWPDAKIVGMDSSADMLKEAKTAYPDIQFAQGDIANFAPQEKIDCLFANASLQWLDQHEILIPRLLQNLRAGGMFAIQMPNNFHAPSHQIAIEVLQARSAWQPLIKKLIYGVLTAPFYQLTWYYDVFTHAKAHSLQLWETEYYQEMADYQGIYDWVKGTGLRPVLSAMDDNNQSEFASAYVSAIAAKYPQQANHRILLPYRRLFMVGSV